MDDEFVSLTHEVVGLKLNVDWILKALEAKETTHIVNKAEAKSEANPIVMVETADYANNPNYNRNYQRSEGDWNRNKQYNNNYNNNKFNNSRPYRLLRRQEEGEGNNQSKEVWDLAQEADEIFK